MCSKINSPEAEICAFCGARIKPLGSVNASSGTGSPASPAEPEKPSKDDESDWLSSLRGTGPSNIENPPGSTPSEEEEQGDDAPDWLSRIRTRAKTETGDTGDLPGQEKEDQPDWMSDLRGTESPAAKKPVGKTSEASPATPPARPSPGEPEREDDWFTRLGGKVETPEEQAPAGEQGMDWFGQLSGDSTGGAPAPFDFDTPDKSEPPLEDVWGSGTSSWEPSQTPTTPAPGSADFSWLDTLSGETEETQAAQPDQISGTSGFGLTGFLKQIDEEPAAPFQPTTPDAGGFGDFFSTPAEEQQASPAQPDQVPDWLGKLEASSSGPAPETTPEEEESLPGWLGSDFGAKETKTPAQPQEGEAALPDWLSGLGAQPSAAQPQEPAVLPGDEDSFGSLPAWMNSAAETPAARLSGLPEAQPELPDWLSSLGPAVIEPQEPAAKEPAAMEPAAEEPMASIPEASLPEAGVPAEALPGFAFLDAAEGETPEEEVVNIPAPFIDDESPAWLRDFGAQQPADTESNIPALIEMEGQAGPEAAGELPFAADLPEWLDAEGETQEQETAQTPSPAEAASEELVRAEIPVWLKPMRPFDTIATGEALTTEADQRAEKSGPLSGLRGVLPVAENLFRYRKPPIYSTKLRMTEKQRTQASLFETILQQESQPLVIQPENVHAPRMVLRLLIALALVFVLLVPSYPGINFTPLSTPVLYPAELLNMFQQIDQNLSQGQESTVLLAVDYEPGLSGEMQAAAAPVISHLMAKNARLVVVSTTPSGPILADQLLRQVAGSVPGFGLNERVVNLGYLPGGTISLLEFVQHPQLAAPATLSGQMAWQATFLSSLSGFKDFAQVIVLTDTAETGRAWVEQVSPNMGNVPLFMVASAQAAPLLVPYLKDNNGKAQKSGQRGGHIDGMISGLLGGAQYGWVAQQANNPAGRYWAAYQIGIIMAIVLILAGGLYSGMKRILGRDQKDEA
jgi:hypothetical protein